MATSSSTVQATDTRRQLDSVFEPWARSDRPGLVVGVRHHGRIVYRRAFGMASLEAGRALTPASRIRIGSTSKHMTALLALLIAARGLIDMDAPIRTYVAELEGPGGDPTIRQLLRHTGGSRCYFDLSTIAHLLAMMPQGRALELQVRQRGRNFAPGTAMIYNNGGYHLVSLALERAAGRPFEALIAEELFRPLGMADTVSLPTDLAIVPGMATLHVPDGEGWRRGVFPSEEVRGEGGVLSTADDMLKWTAHLVSRSLDGDPVWGELMERPVFPDGAVGNYALGLVHGEHRGRATLFHAGGVIGGLSQMLLLPEEELEIVILTNREDADPVSLAEQVADAVLGEEGDAPREDLPDGLAGTWFCEEQGMVYTLGEARGAMRLGICGGDPVVPLRARPDGRITAASPSTGEVILDYARSDQGSLRIRFGGVETAFRRAGAPARGAVPNGSFVSHDAHCVGSFDSGPDHELFRTTDAFGHNEYRLDWLSGRLAIATATRPGLPFKAVVVLDADGRGFTLNTSRTRWLRFEPADRR